jgi:uncharacterized membrane protein
VTGTLDGDRAFVWQSGSFKPLTVPGSTTSQGTAINDRGQVIVVSVDLNTGYVWQPGALTQLPGLIGHLAHPTAINDRSQIAGSAATVSDNTYPHAVLWTR